MRDFFPLCLLSDCCSVWPTPSNLMMSCKMTCLPPRLVGWSREGFRGFPYHAVSLIVYYTVHTLHLVSHTHTCSSSVNLSSEQGCSFPVPSGIVPKCITAPGKAEMPGIIDDEVGHVIWHTFSHLLLSGIVAPPPFTLIVLKPLLLPHRPIFGYMWNEFGECKSQTTTIKQLKMSDILL